MLNLKAEVLNQFEMFKKPSLTSEQFFSTVLPWEKIKRIDSKFHIMRYIVFWEVTEDSSGGYVTPEFSPVHHIIGWSGKTPEEVEQKILSGKKPARVDKIFNTHWVGKQGPPNVIMPTPYTRGWE